MKPAKGINVLEIKFEFNGVNRSIYPTLINDDKSLILVDTGFQGQLALFRAAIEKIGFDISNLTSIIITHHDRDHIGGLSDIVNLQGTKIEVLSHEIEKQYIEGKYIFKKKAPAGQENVLPLANQMTEVKVSRCLHDGERLDFNGGIKIIHTPGHTPGHICLYCEDSKILITGDALNVNDGNLAGPNPMYTHDMQLAISSLRKLTHYDIRGVICYHGGYFENDVNKRIVDIIKNEI